MSVDTKVKTTYKKGFEPEDLADPVTGPTENRRSRQIKNRMKNRLSKRLALYTRSIAITKDKTKLKVLEGKAEAIGFALQTLDAV